MRKLIALDLYRIRKDILLKVSFILIGIFVLLNVGMNFGIKILVENELEELDSVVMLLSGRYLFGASFSMGSNMGIMIPIFAAAICCKDFSMGTIRNKMICGYTRTQIYVSHYICGLIYTCALMLIYAFANLGFGTLVLGYGERFDGEQLLFLLVTTLVGLSIYCLLGSIAIMLATMTGNLGLSIVIYIAFSIGFSLISAALTLWPHLPKLLEKLVAVLPDTLVNSIAVGATSWKEYWLGILLNVLFAAVLGIFGWLCFRKKDLK